MISISECDPQYWKSSSTIVRKVHTYTPLIEGIRMEINVYLLRTCIEVYIYNTHCSIMVGNTHMAGALHCTYNYAIRLTDYDA